MYDEHAMRSHNEESKTKASDRRQRTLLAKATTSNAEGAVVTHADQVLRNLRRNIGGLLSEHGIGDGRHATRHNDANYKVKTLSKI